MATIQTLARELSAAFTDGERESTETGAHIRILRDGSPEWMTDAVHAAHGDMLPDDWRYRMIEECADVLAELDDDADPEDADTPEPSIYTAELCRWLGSYGTRYGFCDEVAEEYGSFDAIAGKDGGIVAILQAGQAAEYREIMGQLIEALRTELAARDETETEVQS